MTEPIIIRTAAFDPKVKSYWLFSGVLLCIITIVGIPFILLWIPIGLFLTGRFLARMECVLTEKSLKVKKGILTRTEKTIPLEKITDMGMLQGPLMRYYGLHKLSVETAGQSGAGALVSLTGIVDAIGFREAVLAQRELLAERRSSLSGAPAEGAAEGGQEALVDIRDALLRIEKLLAEQGTRSG